MDEKQKVKTASGKGKAPTAKRKKRMNRKKKKLLIILICILVVVAGGITAFLLFTRGSITMTGAVKNYFKAVADEDADKYIRTCYPAAWSDNYHLEGEDVDLNMLVENVFAHQSGTRVTDVEMSHEEELEDMFVRRIRDKIKELYDVDLSLSAVYRVYFRMKVSYDNNGRTVEYESDTVTRYVYKYMGKWYYLADTMLLMDMDLDE